ncbi:hypothetical protein F5B18DRAFT_645350 [Nemania serpens]|nr:hypothetical protein F5B18DRAFT_645350 [Nemania serpens]
MLGTGSGTHHCPVCKQSARSRCVKQRHLEMCNVCNQAWSLTHEAECPYCRDAREKAAQRIAKEAAKKKKKGGK